VAVAFATVGAQPSISVALPFGVNLTVALPLAMSSSSIVTGTDDGGIV
jgi:hypothetical protein